MRYTYKWCALLPLAGRFESIDDVRAGALFNRTESWDSRFKRTIWNRHAASNKWPQPKTQSSTNCIRSVFQKTQFLVISSKTIAPIDMNVKRIWLFCTICQRIWFVHRFEQIELVVSVILSVVRNSSISFWLCCCSLLCVFYFVCPIIHSILMLTDGARFS